MSQAVATGIEGRAASSGRLGLTMLTALVVGSMIGGGVFSLPQNMAKGAGPAAILIGWLITGVGMLALALVYQRLSLRKPQLDSGPYAYAEAGFGRFIGFNAAWGYWLSAWIGNVSYAVLIFGTLGHFFPAFGSGNTWQAVLGASAVLWAIHFLVLSGVRQAALVNVVTTIAKLLPIALFILFVGLAFDGTIFSADIWSLQTPELGDVMTQVKSTMLVTLWVFIGIEGASVVSGRAERRSDIGRATILGFLVALTAYLLVSLLSIGAMSRAELGGLPDTASMANVLEHVVGPWGDTLIRVGLMISVGGAFLSWTLFAAEIPQVAASRGTLPALFTRENSAGSPSSALWITNILVQAFLVLTLLSESTYTALFYIASTAILVPYVLSGAYALKLALSGEAYAAGESRTGDMIIGAIATIYGCWLVYAAGPAYLLMCALLYAAGLPFYWKVRQERGEPAFTGMTGLLAAGLVIAAAVAAWLMWTGAISPL